MNDINKLSKRTLLVTICLLMALSPFYAAPSGVQANTLAEPRYGGTLRIAYPTDVISFNTIANFWSNSIYYGRNIYNKLCTYDDLFNIQGDVVKSFEITSEPDYPSVYTFELEHNIRWQDGTPLTSKDVKFTFETTAWSAQDRDDVPDPEINDRLELPAYMGSTYLANLKKIEIIDDYTTKFYFSETQLDSWLPYLDGFGIILPEHLWNEFNKNNPAGQTFENNQYNNAPVGSGPFKVVDYVPDQYVIMDRNMDYFRGVPYLENLVWNVMTDPISALLALENGEIDTIHENNGFPQAEIARINNNPQFSVDAFPYTTTWRVTVNHHPNSVARWPWVGDKKVLGALEHAIDKDAIVKNVLFSITKPTDTVISWIVAPYGADYNTDEFGYTGPWKIVKRTYNPNGAAQLLDDAGWTLNADGVRHKVIDGKDHKMDNFEMPYYHYATAWAEAICQYWSVIGVLCEPVPIEDTSFFQGIEAGQWGLETVEIGGPYPLGLNTMGGGPDPDQTRYYCQSRDEWNGRYSQGADNFGFYSNERVDELYDIGKSTADYEKRKVAYDEAQYLIHQDVGFIFLWNKWKVEAWNNEFAGFGSNRPIAWWGSYFRGNDSSSNLEDGVYWRGGSANPEGDVVTITDITTKITETTVPEFMDLRVLSVMALSLFIGFVVYRKRRLNN